MDRVNTPSRLRRFFDETRQVWPLFHMLFLGYAFMSHAGATPAVIPVVTPIALPEATALTASGAKNLPGQIWGDVIKKHRIPLQVWFDDITKDLDLNDRADIDLITFRGAGEKIVRIPRYMVVRDWVHLLYSAKNGFALAVTNRAKLNIPHSVFEIQKINQVQLARHTSVYPGIALTIRTNPAASRGEKVFFQNCLSCHGIPKTSATPLQVQAQPQALIQRMSPDFFTGFQKVHPTHPNLELSPKEIRGLEAYRDVMLPSGK